VHPTPPLSQQCKEPLFTKDMKERKKELESTFCPTLPLSFLPALVAAFLSNASSSCKICVERNNLNSLGSPLKH